ncbi:MAG TPA: arabinofuranosyltransferase [Acidimicrobiia bacterium]|nr:arabinofuranosyltransferase [Acidimicrobiia bacterium]
MSGADPTTDVVVWLSLLVVVGAAAGILVAGRGRDPQGRNRAVLVALLAGLFLAVAAALVLRDSDFPPLGVALDQGFRVASITKYAHTWSLVDFAYQGLPAFYPPLFFWILGRTSAWTSIEPYEALKLGLLGVALVVPVLGLALWKRVVHDWWIALALALVTLAFHDWYEPYAWLAVAVFVPWWLAWVLQVGARDDPSRAAPSRAVVVGGAAIGGALVCTYYYFFFIGAVQLVLLLALRPLGRRYGVALPFAHARRALVVLAGAALFSAVYWLPLAVSILTTPGARSMQNRYYDPTQAGFPLHFLEFDLLGWIMLFGLVSLALTMFRSQVAMALATMLAAAYAWFALGYLGVLVDEPLLTVKTLPLIDIVLLAGAALGAVDVARAVRRAPALVERFGPRGVTASVAVLTVVVAIALGRDAITAIPYVEEQRAATVPTLLLTTFERATRGRAADTVVLTDQEQLPEYLPVFVFNVWNAHYSNPAAQFDDRTRFLERLAAERDPTVFAAALAHNRYDDVASIALMREGDTLPYHFFDDAFPHGVAARTIVFRTEQFDDRWFAARGSDALAVYVPKATDPRGALDAGQHRALARRFAGDLEGQG